MLRGSVTPSEILSSVKDVFHPDQNIPERSGTTPFDPATQHPQHHHHNYALAPDDGLFLQTPSPLTQSEAKLPDPLYVPTASQDVTMRPASGTRLGSPLAYEDHAMPGYRGRRASERPLSSPRMGTRPGSSRRDIMELTSVSLVGKQKSAEFDDGKEASEDVALAKWRVRTSVPMIKHAELIPLGFFSEMGRGETSTTQYIAWIIAQQVA